MAFLHEKLEVYQKSLVWVQMVDDLVRIAGEGISYPFVDQLTRAALSIPLNIAEGNGRWHKGEKQQFFRIARGSTFECAAILDILQRKNLLKGSVYHDAYTLLETLSKMLQGLINSVQTREDQLPRITSSSLHGRS